MGEEKVEKINILKKNKVLAIILSLLLIGGISIYGLNIKSKEVPEVSTKVLVSETVKDKIEEDVVISEVKKETLQEKLERLKKEQKIEVNTGDLKNPITIGSEGEVDFNTSLGVQLAFQQAIDKLKLGKNDGILIKNGVYELEDSITFTGENITISGESKEKTIIYGAKGKDIIGWNGNNGYLKNLTIDGLKNESYSNFSVGMIQGMTLDSVKIVTGKEHTGFGIYFAGPKHQQEVSWDNPDSAYNMYLNENFIKDVSIINSEIISKKQSDIAIFSLVKGFKFIDNKMTGKLVVYLSKKGEISGNTWIDSESDGIAINSPVEDIQVKNNVFLNTKGNGIHITPQIEHEIPLGVITKRVEIYDNKLTNTSYVGILVDSNGAARSKPIELNDLIISKNTIEGTGRSGIYILGSDKGAKLEKINISENTIKDTGKNNDFGATGRTSIAIDDWWSQASEELRKGEKYQNIKDITIEKNILDKSTEFGIKYDYPVLAETNDEYKVTLKENTISNIKTDIVDKENIKLWKN